MRKRIVLLATGGLTACATPPPPPAPPPAVVMAAPAVSAPIQVAQPEPLVDPTALPSQSAVVASLDPARASAFLGALTAGMPREILELFERELPLANGGVTGGNAAGALGIDTARPIRMGIALTPEGRAVLDAMRSVAPTASWDASSPESARRFDATMQDHQGPLWQLRIGIPVSDGAALLSAVHSLLERGRWNQAPFQAGLESLWSNHGVAVALSTGAGSILVDLLIGVRLKGRALGESVAQTLRASVASGGAPAPALEGHAVRAVYSPSKLAEVGFVDGVSKMHRALSSVDEGAQERIRGEGLYEASANFELAGNATGVFFERVELTIDADPLIPTLHGRALLGPGLRPAPGACGPSIAVDFPGMVASFETSSDCLKAMQVPSDSSPGQQRSEFFSRVRAAGWSGDLVALPFHVLSPARSILQDRTGIEPAAMAKFERFGIMLPSRLARDVYWGLLRAGTTRADAECSIVASARACAGKRRLRAGATVDVGDGFGRLVSLGGRYVVLMSRDRGTLDDVKPSLTTRPVPPMRGMASSSLIAQELRMAGINLTPVDFMAESTLEDGRQLTLSIRPTKAP